jgi:hypothetical protein
VVPDEIAEAVKKKENADQAEMAKLIAKGTPVAKLNTGIDGGMNQIFAAQVPGASTGLSEGGEGQGLSLSAYSRAPGTIPGTVNPPRAPDDTAIAASAPAPVQAAAAPAAAAPAQPAASTRVASAAPNAESGGFFSNLARKIGMGGSSDATSSTQAGTPAPAKPKTADTKTAEVKTAEAKATEAKAAEAKAAEAKAAEAKAKALAAKPAETKQAVNRPPFKPGAAPETQPADAAAAPKQAASVLAGAQPIVQPNSFDNRFSAMK